MKLKYEFAARTIMGENLFIPLNRGALEVSGIAYTNEAAATLMNCLREEQTEDTLLSAVLEEYEIDEPTARRDISAFLDKLRALKLLEE